MPAARDVERNDFLSTPQIPELDAAVLAHRLRRASHELRAELSTAPLVRDEYAADACDHEIVTADSNGPAAPPHMPDDARIGARDDMVVMRCIPIRLLRTPYPELVGVLVVEQA